ncbi:hypothetical protein [uncultured Ruthenibacterium sp.]|uniref:hypothetical protein n=1 Tax=uncultured Ruthenibacterium sp. TaxID=1905347 RepID=UPI00349EBC20
MKQSFSFRLAKRSDKNDIVRFLDKNWDSRHPLVHLDDFFTYYYADGENLQFALCEAAGQIVALAGYIRANQSQTPDIWVSIWCADKKNRGAGMELLDALPRLCNARLSACNNIRPQVIPLYRFLGYEAGRLPHYYRLADKSSYSVARISKKRILPVEPGPFLQRVESAEHLAKVYTPHSEIYPFKDLWYLTRRYFHYPRQKYDLWHLNGNLLATRSVPANGTTVLRIVDYVGLPENFPDFGAGIDHLMTQIQAEYADCYCAGISPAQMERAGFCQRLETDENILPNYLTPPLYENTEYYYSTTHPEHFLLFKADGDQDRPNLTV